MLSIEFLVAIMDGPLLPNSQRIYCINRKRMDLVWSSCKYYYYYYYYYYYLLFIY